MTIVAAQPQTDVPLHFADLQIGPTEGLVVAGERALAMSVREFGLLVALAERSARIVSREDLYRLVWGGELRCGDRSVDVYVHKLRVKLEQALPAWSFIHTHTGFGYRFDPEPVVTDPGEDSRTVRVAGL